MVVDSAIYVDGKRTAEPYSLRETYEACRQRRGLAWSGLYRPAEEEFASVAKEFGLHELAVEEIATTTPERWASYFGCARLAFAVWGVHSLYRTTGDPRSRRAFEAEEVRSSR